MRNFIISALCLVLVVGIWYSFHSYAKEQTNQFQIQLEVILSEQIEKGHWEIACKSINSLSGQWHSFKSRASYFLDSKVINDIDCTLQRARFYIYASDYSNSTGELSYLKALYALLYQNEKVSITNIF